MRKLLLCLLLLLLPLAATADRIKDLVTVAGVRPNQLVGYGLVVGLDGTGDQTSQTPFTVQSIRAMLAAQGVTIPSNVNLQLKNVASVMVTAERSEEHTSELQSRGQLVCRLLLEK